MEKLILIGYEFLTIMFPAIILIFMFYLIYKRQNILISNGKIIYMIIFSVYLFGVFHYTGAGTIFDVKRYGIELNVSQMNFIPFSDNNIDFVGYGLNIILFMPLGFLLPLIWSYFKKYRNVIICSILFSMLIEISQLFNNRRTDIDDLILNTIGAILGTIIFKLFSHFIKHKPTITKNYKFEVYIYILVTFLCRFFLYDEFGMAKILFKF